MIYVYLNNKKLKLQLLLQLSKIDQLEKEKKYSEPIDIINTSVDELKETIRQRFLNLVSSIDKKNYIVSNEVLDSAIYKKFDERRHNADAKITGEDWSELDLMLNVAYPLFKKKIYLMCDNISYNQYCVCMLIKCKFAQCEIADIMNLSDEGISSIRRRLCKKCLIGENSKASDWDRFIYSL